MKKSAVLGEVKMATNDEKPKKRQYIGIWFDCCQTYGRLYKTADGRFYTGRCHKCLRTARARVGADGTERRFFRGS